MLHIKCDCCGYWFLSEIYPQDADDCLCDLCFKEKWNDAKF